MSSSSASDHRNTAGNAVSMQKRNTSNGMEANSNFDLWLICGRRIPEGKRKAIFTLDHATKTHTRVEVQFYSFFNFGSR
jgi:hypothetical protein